MSIFSGKAIIAEARNEVLALADGWPAAMVKDRALASAEYLQGFYASRIQTIVTGFTPDVEVWARNLTWIEAGVYIGCTGAEVFSQADYLRDHEMPRTMAGLIRYPAGRPLYDKSALNNVTSRGEDIPSDD